MKRYLELFLERDILKLKSQYVHRQMKRLVNVFKWGAGEGMIPATIYQTLACVAPLKK